MEGRPIALVLMEGIVGKERVVERHEAVSQHLRHDGGAPHEVAAAISVREGPTRDRKRRRDRAVHEGEVGRVREISEGLAHGEEGGAEDVLAVDLVSAHDAKPYLGVLQDRVEGSRALPTRQPLRVVDADRKTALPQDHRRCDDGTGPRAAAGFINPRDAAKPRGLGAFVRGVGPLRPPRQGPRRLAFLLHPHQG